VEWKQEQQRQGQDSVYNSHLNISIHSLAWNPAVVGEDDLIVCRIPFTEAMVDVVRCTWAVPDHPRTSVKMAFLLWTRELGTAEAV
jgi:hypothetical protein